MTVTRHEAKYTESRDSSASRPFRVTCSCGWQSNNLSEEEVKKDFSYHLYCQEVKEKQWR